LENWKKFFLRDMKIMICSHSIIKKMAHQFYLWTEHTTPCIFLCVSVFVMLCGCSLASWRACCILILYGNSFSSSPFILYVDASKLSCWERYFTDFLGLYINACSRQLMIYGVLSSFYQQLPSYHQ
jgi:hypothetical protein